MNDRRRPLKTLLPITGIAVVLLTLAARPSLGDPVRLSDNQLDAVTAGTYVSGTGNGFALGLISSSSVKLLTSTGWLSSDGAMAYGLVTSTASTPNSVATSASLLELSIILF